MTGWPPGADVTAAEGRAYLERRLEGGHRDIRVLVGVLIAFDLGYWPTDVWAFADRPDLLRPIAEGRVAEALIGVVAIGLIQVFPERLYAIGTVAGCAGMGALAWTMARCGPPSTPWLYYVFPFVFASMAAELRPLWRAAALGGVGAAVGGGYFGTHPTHLQDPVAPVAIAHFLFLLAVAWIGGVYADLLRVEAFLASSRLAEKRAALASEVAAQTAALRDLVRRTETLRLTERRALARDLHDDLGQSLTAARHLLRHARHRVGDGPGSVGPNLDMIADRLDEIGGQTRRILYDLRPEMVEHVGLDDALQALVERVGAGSTLRVTLRASGLERELSEDFGLVIWRCAQEALTNVARHARAATAEVTVEVGPDDVRLRVADDGAGYDPESTPPGLGLLGMRERVTEIGGSWRVVSAPGAGCAVEIEIPFPSAAQEAP